MSYDDPRIRKVSEKYHVPINWDPNAERILNVRTESMVTFHNVVTELCWNYGMSNVAMVMRPDNVA